MPAKKKKRHIVVKVFVFILLFLAVVCAIVLLINYDHYRKNSSPYKTFIIPRLEVSVFEITSLTAYQTNMQAKMLIHNPLPFNLKADSLQYKLFISGVEVFKSTYASSLDIGKWDSAWIDMPVTIFNDKLISILDESEKQGKDSVVYSVQSTFYSNIPFQKKFDIQVERLLPLFYIPGIKLEKVNYDSLSLKGVTLYLKVMVGNKNKFPFRFKEIKYEFALADNQMVHGSIPGTIDIKEKDSTEIIIPVRISFGSFFKSIGPLLLKRGKVDYTFGMDMKMVSESNMLRDSRMITKGSGTLKEIIKLEKDEKKLNREKNKDKKQDDN